MTEVLVALCLTMLLIGGVPLVVCRSRFRVSSLDIAPPATAAFFGLSTLVAWWASGWAPISSVFHVAQPYLIAGQSALLLYLSGLLFAWFLLFWARPRPSDLGWLPHYLLAISSRKITVVFLVVWAVRVTLALGYGIYYSGSATFERLQAVPYWLTSVYSFTALLAIVLPAWAAGQIARSGSVGMKTIASSILAAESLYAFAQGRRELITLMIIVGLVYWFASGKRWRPAVSLLVGGIFAVSVAFPLFLSARSAALEGERGDANAIVEFYSSVRQRSDGHWGWERLNRNLTRRAGNYLVWSANLARAQESMEWMKGTAATSDLLMAVPGLFYEGKQTLRWGEEAINHHYDLPIRDRPNSVAATGQADFGFAGAFGYGVLFMTLLLFAERVAVRIGTRHKLVASVVLLQTLVIAMNTEMALSGVISSARNIVGLFLLAAAAGAIKDQMRPSDGRRSNEVSH